MLPATSLVTPLLKHQPCVKGGSPWGNDNVRRVLDEILQYHRFKFNFSNVNVNRRLHANVLQGEQGSSPTGSYFNLTPRLSRNLLG